MAHLILWFRTSPMVELERSEYREGETRTQVCVRGNTPQPVQGERGASAGTFAWSASVQAMCIAVLRHRAFPAGEPGRLSGGHGSPAASLDYALSKQPRWLVEMFGTAANGTSRARSIFRRSNPERKRPGPVVVVVEPRLLSPEDIAIYLDGRECVEREKAWECARALEEGWGRDRKERTTLAARVEVSVDRPRSSESEVRLVSSSALVTHPFLATVHQAYVKEIHHVLSQTDIFNPSRFRAMKRDAVANPSFARLAGRMARHLAELDEHLTTNERLGVLCEGPVACALREGDPILVATSPAHVGSLVILRYLQTVCGFRIEVNFKIAHSVEMARRMLSGSFGRPPDVCSLTIATAGSVLGRGVTKHFRPFMVMPRMTHGTVAAAGRVDRTKIEEGEFLLMSEIPATEAFCFDEKVRRKIVKPHRSRIRNTEPDEAALFLREGDPRYRAIIGFPYYFFNAALNRCMLLDDPFEDQNAHETIFFARNEFIESDKRAAQFKIALRDAWLALRERPSLVAKLAADLIEDSSYMGFLRRCVGIHNFSLAEAEGASRAGSSILGGR